MSIRLQRVRTRPSRLLFAFLVTAALVHPAGAFADESGDSLPVEPTADDLFGASDMFISPESSPWFAPVGESQVAGYSDPNGLIDYYEFTSLYPQLSTDKVAVFTCPAYGAVGMTAVEAAAIGNAGVRSHFLALSEGAYTADFVAGVDIPAGSGSTTVECEDYAEANYSGPTVSGAVYITDMSGGWAGPGSTCAVSWCAATWPTNGRRGFVTDSPSFITAVWAHEHGHMLTWPHSNSGNGGSYDNPIDLMSGNSNANGSSSTDPYETTVANLLAAGWVEQSEVQIYPGGDLVVDLATAGTDGTRLVAIEIDADSFWAIGSRISDADDAFPAAWDGVEIMRIDGCGASCYPLNREHTPFGSVSWGGGDGRPVHVIAVGSSAVVEGHTVSVLSESAGSFSISITDGSAYDSVVRVAGSDRYETAAALSQTVFTDPGAVDTVFVATGLGFPDALGAAAAAGHVGAPVLLVGASVPGSVAAELQRLSPTTIYVVGGTSVVSDSVAAQLGAYGSVVRVAGSDRYETAAALSQTVFTDPGAVDTVFVATGLGFPDALGAAAAAGHVGAPVLLVGASVPGSVAAELQRLSPTTIYVVGGTSVVSDSVAAQLGAYGSVVRVAGSDRYETAAALSQTVFTDPGAVDTVFVATGLGFPDALGAAAAAGHVGAPVLLVGASVPGSVAAELQRLSPTTIYVVGGTSVVSHAVVAAL